MSISVEVEAMAGDTIDDVCREALQLAMRLRIKVKFDFNSVTCIAVPGASPDDLARAYHRSLSNDHPPKFAVAHPQSSMEKQPCATDPQQT